MSRSAALAIAALVFLLDRSTKRLVEHSIAPWETVSVIPGFFNLVHTKNPGVAFGLFAGASEPLRTVLLITVAVAVLIFLLLVLFGPRRGGFEESRLSITALSLVLGGALGNFFDRLRYGSVTDFIELYWRDWRFAAFNVADSAITIGAALLILDSLRQRRQSPASGHAS